MSLKPLPLGGHTVNPRDRFILIKWNPYLVMFSLSVTHHIPMSIRRHIAMRLGALPLFFMILRTRVRSFIHCIMRGRRRTSTLSGVTSESLRSYSFLGLYRKCTGTRLCSMSIDYNIITLSLA